jgi:hypothetical protein
MAVTKISKYTESSATDEFSLNPKKKEVIESILRTGRIYVELNDSMIPFLDYLMRQGFLEGQETVSIPSESESKEEVVGIYYILTNRQGLEEFYRSHA